MTRLTEVFVGSAKPGTYREDGGLILRVSTDRWRRWSWLGTINGRQHRVDFGDHPRVKVKEARSLAQEFSLAVSEGMTPEDLGWPPGPTFERTAEALMEYLCPNWANAEPGTSEAEEWKLFGEHVRPKIGGMPIRDVTKWHVMWCLDPLWWSRPDQAKQLLRWMDSVFDFARDSEYIWRVGLNEAHIAHCMNRVVRRDAAEPAGN